MTIRGKQSVAEATSSREEILGDDVIGSIKQEAGQLRQVELSYEPPNKNSWITLAPEPKPVFTYDMLCSIYAVHGAADSSGVQARNTIPRRSASSPSAAGALCSRLAAISTFTLTAWPAATAPRSRNMRASRWKASAGTLRACAEPR